MNVRMQKLLGSYRNGDFLETVYACSSPDRDERDNLSMDLAALHNQGLIDIVTAFSGLGIGESGGPDFFLTRHIFEKALPHLNAPVLSVMRCVVLLLHRAGQDMASGTILHGFVGFCAKAASRPREALIEIESNPDELGEMLPATIAAGSQIDNPSYLAEVVRLSQHSNIRLRQHAVYSMVRIHWPKGATVPNSALSALEQSVVTESDGHILASVVTSAFALSQQDSAHESRAITLIGDALAKGDDYTLHAASNLFGIHTAELQPTLLTLLVTQLRRVKPENKGTIDNIDFGIAHLLKSDPEKAIYFLEELLLAYPDKLKLQAFDSATGTIRQIRALTSKVLTRWFLRGERTLCEGVYYIGGMHHGDDLRIDIDPAELKPLDRVHVLFVAHKAIGYFFMKPITAASIVISLMRHAPDDDVLQELGDLLFDPLLLNYTGSVHEYVIKQANLESGKVQETINRARAVIEEYLEILRSVPELPALHPSQAQREAFRRNFSETMTESMKAAERQSVLFGLFSRQTLLYGNKSINYVHAGDEPPRRMEIPLSAHSVQMEIPRMENLDPYGVDFMLRVFRSEKLRK